MGKKVRKQVTLTEEQAAALEREAQRLGVSESELIRRGLEQVCPAQIDFGPDAPKSFAEEVEFMRERARQIPPLDSDGEPLPKTMKGYVAWLRARAKKYPAINQPRTWKREDAYEGRI